MALPDLILSAYAEQFLNLSATDLTRLPGAITSASFLVRNHCGRYFSRRPSADTTLGPIDELITPELRGPILLQEYPINDVFRVSSCKTVVLSVVNTNTTANQRALTKLTRTGDAITGFTTTGLYLEWWTSGVQNTQTILFSALSAPTIAALALAVTSVGYGWQAWPSAGGSGAGGSDDYSLWPVSELRSGQGAQGALQEAAEFEAWVDDLQIERDDDNGILYLTNTQNNPFTSLRFGPTAGLEYGDEDIRGGLMGIRVVYDGGYTAIPDDLMQAVVEIAKATLERKNLSSTVAQERTDTWNVVNRDLIRAIPKWASDTLAYYRSHAR
jgi:hypothetical protein